MENTYDHRIIKKALLENLKREPERVRDSVKLLWARKPKPFGIKIYKEPIIVTFE